jgi:hypothetical protein
VMGETAMLSRESFDSCLRLCGTFLLGVVYFFVVTLRVLLLKIPMVVGR